MEEQGKPFWQSKSVIGGIVALVAGIAGVFGFDVPQDVAGEVVASVMAIVGGVGGLAYAIGRVKRTK